MRQITGLAVFFLLVTACGGGGAETTEAIAPSPTEASQSTDPPQPVTTAAEDEFPSTTEIAIEECMEPATEIELGATVSDTVDQDNADKKTQFFCVQVPRDAKLVTFELAGLTGDLDLYVGWPDMESVQSGGLNFWSHTSGGTDDKSVVVEPVSVRDELGIFQKLEFVRPGSYYIEVSASAGNVTSPFELLVTAAR